jgi:glycosyltransferase involved in cell wall biosynthesis
MVTTPSDTFARTLTSQLGDSTEVSVIRNGFDEQLFKPADRERPAGAPFTCVNHGLLGRMHNIQLILDVAALVQGHEGIRFLVVGYGPKEPLLRSHGLRNLTFLGPMAYELIPEWLTEADLGIAFIESNEGADGAFPVKVYEYIGAGLPTLVTPLSEAGRLVEERGVGLAFGNDEAARIAERLIALSDRGEDLRAMRDRCREVRLEYSRERASRSFAQRLFERSDGAKG